MHIAMSKFTDWLLEEMNAREWSQADLARRSKLSRTAVSNVLSENRKAGAEFCLSVAVAFGIPPEIAFRRAGLLPPVSPEEVNTQVMVFLFRQLGPVDQQQAINFVRSLLGHENYKVIRESQQLYEVLKDTQTETAIELIHKFMEEINQKRIK